MKLETEKKRVKEENQESAETSRHMYLALCSLNCCYSYHHRLSARRFVHMRIYLNDFFFVPSCLLFIYVRVHLFYFVLLFHRKKKNEEKREILIRLFPFVSLIRWFGVWIFVRVYLALFLFLREYSVHVLCVLYL